MPRVRLLPMSVFIAALTTTAAAQPKCDPCTWQPLECKVCGLDYVCHSIDHCRRAIVGPPVTYRLPGDFGDWSPLEKRDLLRELKKEHKALQSLSR
jgi:hypothetical protein